MTIQSIAKLSRQLADKDISSVELTQDYLARIKQLDGELNSYITVTEELALAQAEQADKLIQQGKNMSCQVPRVIVWFLIVINSQFI